MHNTQMSVKIAREDAVRDEPRRRIKIVCRPRTQVLFGTLLIGGKDDDGKPIVNDMIVYESDLPKVMSMVEPDTKTIAECEAWIESEWQRLLKESTDELGHTNLVRAEFQATVSAEFEHRMRRGILPLVSVELGEELMSPVAIARANRLEADGAALDMLAAKVAERIHAGGRGDDTAQRRRQ